MTNKYISITIESNKNITNINLPQTFKEEGMKKTFVALVSLGLLMALPISACDELGLSGIVEDNDLWISAEQSPTSMEF